MAEKNTFNKGEKAASRSALTLIVLGIIKASVAFVSGSTALIAGTIDTFSDVFSSVAVWVGLRIANKKSTERFPYGYFKAETFALLIVSMIIIASSILIMLESWQKLFETATISFSSIALITAAISAVIYYLLAKYKERIGRQIGSQALVSEGLHSMTDVYTSIVVFGGVFFAVFGYQFVEVFVGFAISIYVLVRGLLFGKDAALVLMDVSPNPQIVKEMKEIAESISGVKGTHAVRVRKSGPVFFGEIHIELQEKMSLEKAHVISDIVEVKVKNQIKNLESLTVHAGLAHKKRKRIAIPIDTDKGLDSSSSLHFGSASYFAILDVEGEQILDFQVMANQGAKLPHKKGIKASQQLVEQKVDMLLASSVGEAPFHILSDNLIQIYNLLKSTKIQEAVHYLSQGSLEKMLSPTEKSG